MSKREEGASHTTYNLSDYLYINTLEHPNGISEQTREHHAPSPKNDDKYFASFEKHNSYFHSMFGKLCVCFRNENQT
jgi:hypothetical protein